MIVIEKDGSGSVADGKLKWDTEGNVTMNNVTMNNITANSGTFAGKIVADNGLRYGVKVTSTDYTIKSTDSFVVTNGQCRNLYFPTAPNAGQMVTILNITTTTAGEYSKVIIYVTNSSDKIYPSYDSSQGVNISDAIGESFQLKGNESYQFIYAGSIWYRVVGQI